MPAIYSISDIIEEKMNLGAIQAHATGVNNAFDKRQKQRVVGKIKDGTASIAQVQQHAAGVNEAFKKHQAQRAAEKQRVKQRSTALTTTSRPTTSIGQSLKDLKDSRQGATTRRSTALSTIPGQSATVTSATPKPTPTQSPPRQTPVINNPAGSGSNTPKIDPGDSQGRYQMRSRAQSLRDRIKNTFTR